MMKIKNKNKGFTIVELMVVVAIISVLATVGIINYNKSRDKRELAMSAEQLAAVIRDARTISQTGEMFEMVSGVGLSRPKKGVGVYIMSINEYILFANQADLSTSWRYETGSDYSIRSYELPSRVQFFSDISADGSQILSSYLFTPAGESYFPDDKYIKLVSKRDSSLTKCVKTAGATGNIEVIECP